MRTTRIAQAKQTGNKLTSIKNTLKFQFDVENDRNDRTTSPTVTIKDLCQEDKAKIGDLIKRLAQEQEDKKKLQDVIKQKEEECKKQVKKYKQLSDSAKKEQKETEEKFKESLEVIKKLQQQEQLIHEQMLQARVNKFDSFTQYEFENKENKIQQAPVQPPKQPKSEILQLKAEIEEITNSLKHLQFEQSGQEEKRMEISPIRGVRKSIQQQPKDKPIATQKQNTSINFPPKPKIVQHCEVQTIDVHQNSADKYIQTETNSAINSHASNFYPVAKEPEIQPITKPQFQQNNNQTIRFYDEFKALESKLKHNQNQYHQATKEPSLQSESFQQQKLDSSDDDEEINIAQELLKRKNQRISQQQYQRRNSTNSQSSQYQQQQLQTQQETSSQKQSQRTQLYQPPLYTQPQNTTNLLQSNQFKTNTLSFNLTNQEYTPQQSVQKSAEQFGSSMLQTPQQRELHSQQLHFSNQEDEIDSVITSLNGRSFNKPNVLQQEYPNVMVEQGESDGSQSSIPREEYQKLIDKYMRENDDEDDDMD